jgi:hypothetical protein
MRSHPLFTLNSDEASRDDDGKWNSNGKLGEGSNATLDIRLADNDAQIWRDQALRESQMAITNKLQQPTGDQIIKDEAEDDNEGNDDDEKLNLDLPTTGGNVNYLRYSMCRSA